jgi:hypothetical protein
MKKLYYQLSDNADVSQITMSLEDCMEWIGTDMHGVTENDDKREFTITPVWLTNEEYNKLPEANF